MKSSQFKMFAKHCEDTCRIIRHEKGAVTSFTTDEEDAEKEILVYEGKCDIQVPNTTRTFTGNGVVKKDDAIFIPMCVEVMEGDIIDLFPKHNSQWRYIAVTKGITKGELTTINVNIPTN